MYDVVWGETYYWKGEGAGNVWGFRTAFLVNNEKQY